MRTLNCRREVFQICNVVVGSSNGDFFPTQQPLDNLTNSINRLTRTPGGSNGIPVIW